MRDFTVKAYCELLRNLKNSGVSVYTIEAWVNEEPVKGVLIRHDVDRKHKNALKIAQIEADFGIKTTYYFRFTSSFDEETIKKISDLGHETGYHYEDLSEARGNYERAIELFKKHLEKLRTITEVKTITMHGRPLLPWDNRDLWEKYNYKDFGILAEAYLDIDYSQIYYFTDTGRTWGQTKANLRDTVKSCLQVDIGRTENLIKFLRENKESKVALVMHPERWEDNIVKWVIQLIKDRSCNLIKCVLRRF